MGFVLGAKALDGQLWTSSRATAWVRVKEVWRRPASRARTPCREGYDIRSA
jgi:hypothetical protein